ncbi:interferon lambda receptor 1-like isoform X1 [Seriola lalandi dorsalis]|nr:interferon lambda receptor 1-like isoform X1 [Seriola lalandi dorsalis]
MSHTFSDQTVNRLKLERCHCDRMNCFPPGLFLMSLLHSVLGSLPAPVNVTVNSVNFQHVLRWDPAPGTPPGTEYNIFKRLQGKKRRKVLNSTTASLKLKLHNERTYYLSVQASYNQTLSPESHNICFTPYKDTKIGPPEVSLAGCGNCIKMNMSLLEPDSSTGIEDINKYYDVHFTVKWRREGHSVMSLETRNKSFTLDNLQEGMEYCVQVHTHIRLNGNTQPSTWECILTGPVEHRGPFVIGIVAALLIILLGLLMTSVFCLQYTGLICTVKATLPRAIIMVLNQGYTLTPNRTIPDSVSISSEKDKQRNHTSPTMPHPNEDEDEEEEEGLNVYMDRDAQLSSGESLPWGSGNVPMNSELGAPVDCGSLTKTLSAEMEVPDAQHEVGIPHRGLDEDETKAKVSVMPEDSQTGVQGHVTGEKEEEEEKEEEMKQEVFDSSGNINLFSVTLAALDAGEKEEEEQNARDSLTDLLRLGDLEAGQLTVQHTDSQTDYQNTHGAGYIRTCETQHEEEEEEEEETFSGYMAHT